MGLWGRNIVHRKKPVTNVSCSCSEHFILVGLGKHYLKCKLSFDNWSELQMTHWHKNSWCGSVAPCKVRKRKKLWNYSSPKLQLTSSLFWREESSLKCIALSHCHFTVASDAEGNADVWRLIALYTTLKSSGSWQAYHLTSSLCHNDMSLLILHSRNWGPKDRIGTFHSKPNTQPSAKSWIRQSHRKLSNKLCFNF